CARGGTKTDYFDYW
nr:immunoglobulin heavy chain junction region [Mus musculus]